MITEKNKIPVNRMAASMFFKTPDWAPVRASVKKMVIESVLPAQIIDIDYFKPPPKAVGNEQSIPDRRGVKFTIERISGSIAMAVIVGYGYTNTRRVDRKEQTKVYWHGHYEHKKRAKKNHKTHVWWTLSEDGDFTARQWKTISKRTV